MKKKSTVFGSKLQKNCRLTKEINSPDLVFRQQITLDIWFKMFLESREVDFQKRSIFDHQWLKILPSVNIGRRLVNLSLLAIFLIYQAYKRDERHFLYEFIYFFQKKLVFDFFDFFRISFTLASSLAICRRRSEFSRTTFRYFFAGFQSFAIYES